MTPEELADWLAEAWERTLQRYALPEGAHHG